MGGHSLLATRLIAQIEKTLGKRVSLASLFQSPTIEGIAKELHEETRHLSLMPSQIEELRQKKRAKEDSALVLFRKGGSRPPLFLHGGSFELSRYLGEGQPCYGILPHGQDGRKAPATVEDMATDYLKQMQGAAGPYLIRLLVWGLVAYEMAQQLDSRGRKSHCWF